MKIQLFNYILLGSISCLIFFYNTNLYSQKLSPFKLQQKQVNLGDRGKLILTYNIEELCPSDTLPKYYCRSGFIHPLYSPSGKVITDGFPVGHTHQHGLFFAWVNTDFRGEFVDFWNQQKETGTVKHTDLIDVSSGLIPSLMEVKLQQVSLKHGPVIEEHWSVKTKNKGDYFIIDLISTQTNITNDTLYIKKYHYGGLGIRGNAQWNNKDATFNNTLEFLTSDSLSRSDANHTRPKWTAMYGEIDGAYAGVAIIDHPDNFRHPQPVRVHPEMPYFCMAPMVLDAMPIAPQQVYQSKYRIVTFDGKPDGALFDQLTNDLSK